MKRMVRVRGVQPLEGWNVLLEFTDGTVKEVNLEVFLRGPIFEPIRNDLATFRSMKIEGGAIAWENGADIDPDVLYYGLQPAWMEQASPRPARSAVMQGIALPQVRESDGVQYNVAQEPDTEVS